MPRLLLIYPGNPDIAEKHRGKHRRFPAIGLPVIASLTPPEWDVTFVDEEIGEFLSPEHYDPDLVGISSMTSQAARAYELGDYWMKRGVKVVHGGSHPSVCPEEAALHGDAVVIGEAERTWPQLLEDWKHGRMQRFYRGPAPEEGWYVAPRRDLVPTNVMLGVRPMVATRGCPYTCSFCSVFSVFGRGYRHRPVKDVVREVEQLAAGGGKHFVFLDDNIIGNPKWSKDLFRELKSLGIKWGGQSTLGVARDPEVVQLAAESGCFALFIGVESVSKASLRSVRKQFNKVDHYKEQVKVFHDNGITIIAGLIFGFDEDDTSVFERTVEVVHHLGIGIANFSILTPLPGTDTFKQMKAENRLLTTDWGYYDGGHVVIKPRLMTPEQLQEGADWASREFYKTSRILGRLIDNWRNPLFYLTVATAYKIGHYFHPKGNAPLMHPLDKLDLLAGHELAPGVPDWLARAAEWEPRDDSLIVTPAERKVSLPQAAPAPQPMVRPQAHPLAGF
ncbi:MAG TPA: radical SAM protein [Polyangia bacterium]|nr:radical SAM protein [Polyangia bacterium]